jgi:hypothetical protein
MGGGPVDVAAEERGPVGDRDPTAAVHVMSRGKPGSDMQALVVSGSEGVSQVGQLRRFK